MEEGDRAVATSKTEGNPIRSDSVGFSRRAGLAIIILLLVIGLAVALWARSYCRSYPGVTIGFLYVGPYTGRGIASSFEVTKLTAWQKAKFYWRSFQQGTRARWMGGYTWLETDLENYVNRTGQRVFVACEIKSTKIPQYNVSAFTEAEVTREYERFMSAHGFVFLRDHTNTVWVVPASKAPAWRQELASRRWFFIPRSGIVISNMLEHPR